MMRVGREDLQIKFFSLGQLAVLMRLDRALT